MSRFAHLPDGRTVRCARAEEAVLTYHEVEDYFAQGLEVAPGQIVVDVGANIGLFSLAVSKRTNGQAIIFALEPIPSTFEMLCHNTKDHPNIHPIPMGLADQPGRLKFIYYPNSTASSTAFPDTDHDAQVDRSIYWLKNMPLMAKYRWLLRLPRSILRFQQSLSVRFQFRGQPVDCAVNTVSGFIKEQGLGHIDVLKVDAEKAEVPILKGIATEDWSRVGQMVLEVHELGHDLPWIQQRLVEQGFDITQLLYGYGSKESGMATVYARASSKQ